MRMQNTLILQVLLLILIQTISVQCQFNFFGGKCNSNETISSNSTYRSNVLTLFKQFNSISSVNLLFTNSSGLDADRVNGFYLCRPDLPLTTCKTCINITTNALNELCFNQKNAIIWLEECMVQYSNNSVSADSGNGTDPWDYLRDTFNVSTPDVFPSLLNTTLQSLISEAVSADAPLKFFAIGKANFTAFEELNGMALCRPDITAENCESCLRTALDRIPICCGGLASSAVILQPNCQLRYDTAPFIFSPNPSSPSSHASTPVPAPASEA